MCVHVYMYMYVYNHIHAYTHTHTLVHIYRHSYSLKLSKAPQVYFLNMLRKIPFLCIHTATRAKQCKKNERIAFCEHCSGLGRQLQPPRFIFHAEKGG